MLSVVGFGRGMVAGNHDTYEQPPNDASETLVSQRPCPVSLSG